MSPTQINCFIVDVIKITLSTCDYSKCTDPCRDYLLNVADNCDVIFHNQGYLNLWNTLFNICFKVDDGNIMDKYFLGDH